MTQTTIGMITGGTITWVVLIRRPITATISMHRKGTVHMVTWVVLIRRTIAAATGEVRVAPTGVRRTMATGTVRRTMATGVRRTMATGKVREAQTTRMTGMIVIAPIQASAHTETTVGDTVDLETNTRHTIIVPLTIIITMVQPTTRGAMMKKPTGHLKVNAHFNELF